MRTIRFWIENHRIINPTQSLSDVIGTLLDWDYELTIKRRRKKRSNDQNSYYWGVIVYLICTETWAINKYMDKSVQKEIMEEIHEALLEKFSSETVRELDGYRIRVKSYQRSKDMSTVEFNDYIERIKQHFSTKVNPQGEVEPWIIFPEPDDDLDWSLYPHYS